MKRLFGTRGRRFIFGGFLCMISMGSVVFGFVMFSRAGVVPILLTFMFGFYIAISFIEKTKCKYIAKYSVWTEKYGRLTFVQVQALYYFYGPIIFFAYPHYYFPYEKKNYLVCVPEEFVVPSGQMLPGDFIKDRGILLDKKRYSEFVKDPEAWLFDLYNR